MKIVYIADDDTTFDNEFDCKDHEWRLNHPNLQNVCFYNENNEKLNDIFTQDTYDAVNKIIVPNNFAAEELQALGKHTGFVLYESITESGEWIYSEDKQIFIKRGKI